MKKLQLDVYPIVALPDYLTFLYEKPQYVEQEATRKWLGIRKNSMLPATLDEVKKGFENPYSVFSNKKYREIYHEVERRSNLLASSESMYLSLLGSILPKRPKIFSKLFDVCRKTSEEFLKSEVTGIFSNCVVHDILIPEIEAPHAMIKEEIPSDILKSNYMEYDERLCSTGLLNVLSGTNGNIKMGIAYRNMQFMGNDFIAMSDREIESFRSNNQLNIFGDKCPVKKGADISLDAEGNAKKPCVMGPKTDCSKCGCTVPVMVFAKPVRMFIETFL
ncbi:hypothetical protein EPN87_03175 [archaeon]|nr:MAG: hypothetical protein EPN87_03175 [archaeon]